MEDHLRHNLGLAFQGAVDSFEPVVDMIEPAAGNFALVVGS